MLAYVTEEMRQELCMMVRRHTTPQQVAVRARIILAVADGQPLVQIGTQVGLSRESVRLWRDRWMALQDIPLSELTVPERLSDAPRPGAPARITADPTCQIVALACEAPQTSGHPISQWSSREIANEVMRRGIVSTISPRHAARLLKRGTFSRTASVTG